MGQMAAIEKMVSLQTFRWLVTLSERELADEHKAIEKVYSQVKADAGEDHIEGFDKTAVRGVFVLTASNKAVTSLQTKAFIEKIVPHAAELKTFEIPIIEDVPRLTLINRFRKLKLFIDENMLRGDIIKMTRKGRFIYVICTCRARDFLSQVKWLGKAKPI